MLISRYLTKMTAQDQISAQILLKIKQGLMYPVGYMSP